MTEMGLSEIETALLDLAERVKKIETALQVPPIKYLPPMYADGAITDRKTAKPKRSK